MEEHKIRWIASYPKSGNTWVRAFLNAYLTGYLDINKMVYSETDVNKFKYQAVATQSLESLKPEIALQYRTAALTNTMLESKIRPLFLKTHQANANIYGIDLIPKILTHSAIYIVRDPRAVAVSFSNHTNSDVSETIFNMNNMHQCLVQTKQVYTPLRDYLTTWSNHVKTWLECDLKRCSVVKYEDMLTDPEKVFKHILEIYNLDYKRAQFNKALKLTVLDKLCKQEAKEGFLENKGRGTFFGGSKDWREVLTPSQLALIQDNHGEVMEKLGYKEE